MHGSHTLGWPGYMPYQPHLLPSMMAQMPWMHPYYYPTPAGYPLDLTGASPPVHIPAKAEKISEPAQETRTKCVSLCADWCNRNPTTSPGLCDVRDDEVDSILSRSSNGSLSPPTNQSGSLPWTEPLSRWLSTHRHRPYPTKREKQKLAEMSGRSIEEVNAWLSSARRALKQKYDEEQQQQEASSAMSTEMAEAWRRMPEIAERVGAMPIPVVQPLMPSPPPMNETRRTSSTHPAPAPPLSSPSPMPSPHSDRAMPVLVPEGDPQHCPSSPDLLSPLVIDFNDQSGRRTANDVTISPDVTNDVETSSTSSEPGCFMKHKKRMLQRFLKEETSQDAELGSPEKRSRKEYNRLELSAVSALISMGSQDSVSGQSRIQR